MVIIPNNMYQDAIFRWNVCIGCRFKCIYCKNSFQAQMKRQKWNCKILNKKGLSKCFTYEPHIHEDRLRINFNLDKYETIGDQFIWAISAGDISFMKSQWVNKVLKVIKKFTNRTFFFQSKNPKCFSKYELPDNLILDITLETNRNQYYQLTSKAPKPKQRFLDFLEIEHPRKRITIEPIMEFDLDVLEDYILRLNPEIVYVGYDSRKSGLEEPELNKVRKLMDDLSSFTRVKEKLIRERYQY